MEEKLDVAIIQSDLVWENAEGNLKRLEGKINKLSGKVDLIVLPEMFSTGFSMNPRALAEPENGDSLQWMQKIASEKDTAITGSLIISEKGEFYNRLFFVFPDGSFKKYDKRHTFTLAGEDKYYSSGQKKLILNYKGWKICPLVCYDLRFPVWARNAEDYDVLIFIANWPAKRTLAWDTLLPARAIENLVYCIGVNRVGTDGNSHQYIGHSAVYDCLGEKISSENIWEKEFEQIISLEKKYLEASRNKFRFLQDRDEFKIINS